jgi:hypothetical protein
MEPVIFKLPFGVLARFLARGEFIVRFRLEPVQSQHAMIRRNCYTK